MQYQPKKPEGSISEKRVDANFDLDALLHPAGAFAHPLDVVRDTDLTLNEKRAILASWASDACAVEATPELRINSAGNIVRWDDIMDALRALDQEARGRVPVRSGARLRWRRWRDARKPTPGDSGHELR